jgi:hypothetical protein
MLYKKGDICIYLPIACNENYGLEVEIQSCPVNGICNVVFLKRNKRLVAVWTKNLKLKELAIIELF